MIESPQHKQNLIRDLSTLMNRYGIDADLDIPDYILANNLYRHLTNLAEGKEELQRWNRLTHDHRTPGRTAQEKMALGGVGPQDKGRPHPADGVQVQ
jgi:hypothetical protein